MSRGFPPLPALHFLIEVDAIEVFDDTYDGTRVIQALRRGAMNAANLIQGVWVTRAQALGLRNTGLQSYVGGIQKAARIEIVSEQMTFDPKPDQGGQDVSWYEIVVEVTNTCPHAQIVEEGHAAFHLPSKINWAGPNVKHTKKGTPYLSIPFRHRQYQTEKQADIGGATRMALRAMMPEAIHKEARKLSFTRPMRAGRQYDAQGRYTAKDRYHWGGRLNRSGASTGFHVSPGGTVVGERRGEHSVAPGMVNPAWKSSKFHGMFKSGTKGHPQYMTIRTITPDSPGWNIPALAGKFIAAQVASGIASSNALEDRFSSGVLDVLHTGGGE